MNTRIFGFLAPLILLTAWTSSATAWSTLRNKGDLRMSSGVASASMDIGTQTSFYGEFDYYLTDAVSLNGTSQLPLQAVDDLRPYFTGMNFNFH